MKFLNNYSGPVLVVILVFPLHAQDRGAAWFKEKRELVQATQISKDEESTRKLATLIRFLGDNQLSDQLTPEGQKLFEASKSAIVGVPGYVDTLVRIIDKEMENEVTGSSSGGAYRSIYCEALAYIHDPKAVRALGELLFDERDPWKDVPQGDTFPARATAYYAVQAFHKMRLQDPPVAEREYDENVAAWQQWYREVRDGNRTFSFEGDPKVYTLTGPVQPETPPVVPKLPVEPVVAATQPSGPGWALWAALFFVVAAGLAAVVLARSKKRSAE